MTIDIAVTGASGAIGRRLVGRFETDREIGRIVGFDATEPPRRPRKLEFHPVELSSADLKPRFEGVDVVVHLAGATSDVFDDELMAKLNIEGTRRVLDAAAAVGVKRVVRLSTASVYGAWPDNPVPMDEDQPLRPNPGYVPAAQAAEVERLMAEWRRDHPGTAVAVLRAAPVISGQQTVMRILQGRPSLRVRGASPVAQVVHADDVASALDLAAHSLDGVFNVACDGWLSADDAAALMRHPLTPALSAETLTSVLRTGWRLGLSDVPPEIVPYLVYSWAISNARLRAAGWEPKYTNAQALAEAQASFEPADTRVAQFAAAGSAAVAGGATLAWFARRHHNKRRHP